MLLSAFCVTLLVFLLSNLQPNLEKLAKFQGDIRMSDTEVSDWLASNGYARPVLVRYGEWLGVVPGFTVARDDGTATGRCTAFAGNNDPKPRFCGILQGYWGHSTVFKVPVGEVIATRLGYTGKLMAAVMLVMIPSALILGVIAGMRQGSRTDRSVSSAMILTTATPEYVSGVILCAIFASSAVGLRWFTGSAASATSDMTFANITLPVLTISLFGMGYIARMTRASMAEVMTAQYIRTARLKGLKPTTIVLKHALRNALIAPFTVIMLQIPWLLNGVVIVETLFNYKGFGWTLVQAANNNDIELLLGISIVSVFVVLATQLISDIGYVFLNPRIRVT